MVDRGCKGFLALRSNTIQGKNGVNGLSTRNKGGKRSSSGSGGKGERIFRMGEERVEIEDKTEARNWEKEKRRRQIKRESIILLGNNEDK